MNQVTWIRVAELKEKASKESFTWKIQACMHSINLFPFCFSIFPFSSVFNLLFMLQKKKEGGKSIKGGKIYTSTRHKDKASSKEQRSENDHAHALLFHE